jgi:hypothetical protein
MKNMYWPNIIVVFLADLSLSMSFLRNLRNLRINRWENPFPLYIMEPGREAIPWVC